MAKYEPTDRSRSDTGGASGANPVVEGEKLRKAMVQQMMTSNKLVQAVFAIDRDYFGSRFHGEAQEAASTTNPFSEIEVATRVVETLGEELQGATAFADSPVLRDGVHNLVASIDGLRKTAIEIEKASLEAVGLPGKVTLEARQFPDHNPLACINQAIGFNHELIGIISRLLDRVQGLKMMLNEAERARSEAEDSVTPVNADEVAGELSRAVQERDAELVKLRAQANAQQDQADATARDLAAQVDEIQSQLDQEHESRQSDVAEVRSLAAEVSQLASIAEAGVGKHEPADDLIITGSVLRDALSDGSGLAQMATAAEAVLVEWAAYVNRRLARLQAEIDALRAQGKDPGNVAAMAGDLAALRAEAERERQQAKEAASALTRANQDRQTLERKLADSTQAATAARSEIESQLTQARAALAKAAADQQANERRLAESRSAGQGSEKAARDLAQARAEIDQAKEVLRVATADKDRALAEAARLKTQAQADADRLRALEVERDKVKGEFTALTRKQQPAEGAEAKPTTEMIQLRNQGAQAAERLKGLMTERDRLSGEVARLRSMAEQSKTIADQERSRITADLERVKAALADKDRLAAELARARTQADQAKAAADQARAQADQERVRVAAEQERSKALAIERDRLAGEVAKHRTLAEQSKANADQARVNADQARTLAEQARGRETQLAAELAKARDQQTATATTLYQAQTEKTALLRERDQARSAIEEAKGAAQAAVQAATRRDQETERQLAALREQFAETRSLHTSLVKERDDLKKHLDEFRRSTDMVKAQADEKHGSLTRDLTHLRTAEAALRGQLAVANADLARQQQRTENLTKDLDAARAAAAKAGELGAQVETLGQERTQFKATQTDLTQARSALTRTEAELKAARDQVAELKAAHDSAVTERTAWGSQRAELQAQLDSGKLVATATAGERDRLRRDLERLQGEHGALAKRFEERESQLTARLTETSRQLGELKQTNVRLASEQETIASQAVAHARDAQRSASEAAARESTGVWHKRLADSAAGIEEARSRAAALEQKLVDGRKRIAELEERCARQEAGESHQRKRTGELEHRLMEADRVRAEAAKAAQDQAALQGRLIAIEGDVARYRDQAAAFERRLADNAQLLRDARAAVEAAKRRQDGNDAADRAIIAELVRELEGFKKAAKG